MSIQGVNSKNGKSTNKTIDEFNDQKYATNKIQYNSNIELDTNIFV